MATRRQGSTLALTASGVAIGPTWPAATLAGSLLVGVVYSRDSDESPGWSPPDEDWTLAVASTPTADTPRTLIYYIENAASRSGAESFSHNGVAKPLAAWVEEWEPGAGEAITLDQVASTVIAGGGSNDRPTGTTPMTGGATIQVGGVANRNGSRTLTSIQDLFTERVNGVTGTGFTNMVVAGGSKAEAAAEAGATGWTVSNVSGSNASGAIAAFLVAEEVGGQTVAITAAVETDLAGTLSSKKTKTLDVGVETDLSATVGRLKRAVVPVALEVDLAAVLGRAKRSVLSVAAEMDVAATFGQAKTQALAPGLETDVAVAFGLLKRVAVPVAVENDLAQVIQAAGNKIVTLTLAAETDVAAVLGIQKRTSLAPGLETDLAGALGSRKAQALDVALEADLAAAVGRAKRLGIGAAAEVDVASALAHSRRYALAVAAEADFAAHFLSPRSILLVVALEVDAAGEITYSPFILALPPAVGNVTLVGVTAGGIQSISGVQGTVRQA